MTNSSEQAIAVAFTVEMLKASGRHPRDFSLSKIVSTRSNLKNRELRLLSLASNREAAPAGEGGDSVGESFEKTAF